MIRAAGVTRALVVSATVSAVLSVAAWWLSQSTLIVSSVPPVTNMRMRAAFLFDRECNTAELGPDRGLRYGIEYGVVVTADYTTDHRSGKSPLSDWLGTERITCEIQPFGTLTPTGDCSDQAVRDLTHARLVQQAGLVGIAPPLGTPRTFVVWPNVFRDVALCFALIAILSLSAAACRGVRSRSRRARIARGVCPQCLYQLSGLDAPRCPECGGALSLREQSTLARRSHRP